MKKQKNKKSNIEDLIKNTTKEDKNFFSNYFNKNTRLLNEDNKKAYTVNKEKILAGLIILFSIFISKFLYSVYSLFTYAYKLPIFNIYFVLVIGLIIGIFSYKLSLKSTNKDLYFLKQKGIVLDIEKEYKNHKIIFIFKGLKYSLAINILTLIAMVFIFKIF